MNTEEIMELALELSGLKEIPEDSAIYVSGENIRKALVCIDAGPAELLLARQLGFDVVIAHHPAGGTAILNFPKVFRKHIQQMVEAGVPRKVAEEAVSGKLEQLEVEAHRQNYLHAIDFAKLLGMPFMNVHNPLDIIGRQRMIEQLDNRLNKDSTVADVVSALMELPELKTPKQKSEYALENRKIRLEKLLFPMERAQTEATRLQKRTFNMASTQ